MPVIDPNSALAKDLFHAFLAVLIVSAVIFLIVTGLIAFILVRFRSRGREDEPPRGGRHTLLEVTWTVVPLLTVTSLFVYSVLTMHRVNPSPGHREPDLVVVGHQWWWEFRYPKAGVITANEMHMPVGPRWLVEVLSADVIHDFWVPELSRKIEAVPSHPNYMWIQAGRPGEYTGTCAQYCGAEHAWMRILAVAQPETDYERWLRQQQRPAATVTSASAIEGERLFFSRTCVNCHAITGTSARGRVGPDLTHLAERQTIGAGVLQNTHANLVRWLKNPQAIKPGIHMPDFHLTHEQAEALADYLEAIR